MHSLSMIIYFSANIGHIYSYYEASGPGKALPMTLHAARGGRSLIYENQSNIKLMVNQGYF